jgi:hypothetical protein
VRQIGGFMAPWSRKNLPRTLQVLGAGLQQIGDNRGQLSQFSANEAEQQRYAAEQAVQARGQKVEEQRYAGELDWRQSAPQREREQYTWQRQYDAENPEPITPYQQATLDLQRRGQNLSAESRAPRALPQGDQRLLDRVTDQGDQAQNFLGLVNRFVGLNTQQPTGQFTDLNPGSWFGQSRERREEMVGLTSQMITQVRGLSGEGGIMTDSDATRFERGLPSVQRGGNTNGNFASAAQQVAQNATDRVAFMEAYGSSGSLQGARSDWNRYLTANPIYDTNGGIRTNRPNFEEWLQMGAPDMSRERSPSNAVRDISNEDLLRALRDGDETAAEADRQVQRRSRSTTPQAARGARPGAF